MVKAPDNAYEAAKIAWTCYGWLLQEAAADLGWKKAIAVNGRVGQRMAETLVALMHAQRGPDNLTAAHVLAVCDRVYKAVGLDYELQAAPTGVTGRYQRCPIYDGLAASGLEHAAIQKVCESLESRESETFQQAFPEVRLTAKFRMSPQDACVEEFTLVK